MSLVPAFCLLASSHFLQPPRELIYVHRAKAHHHHLLLTNPDDHIFNSSQHSSFELQAHVFILPDKQGLLGIMLRKQSLGYYIEDGGQFCLLYSNA